MHNVKLPAPLLKSIRDNDRRQRFFIAFAGPRTALLVIDMQSHWVHPHGACHVAHAAGIVDNINRLAAALRVAGGTVVWIQSTLTLDGPQAWPMLFDCIADEATADLERRELMAGSPMHELCRELDVRDGDWFAAKCRFSAFIPGASDLGPRLRTAGIDSLIVTGVTTNICCESTARDAMMLDFRTVMIDDANAAYTDEEHLAGLWSFAQVFGDVLSTADLLPRIGAR